MNPRTELKNLIISDDTLIMPDAYDPISARIIEKSGFKAIQCSGYSYSIAAARNQEIDISLEENIQLTAKIVDATNLPVMADAEDGYGDAVAVARTVKKFMDAGVAGLNLEDQILSSASNSIVTEKEMCDKIQAAREVSENENNPDFIINGRTDALKTMENREDALNIAVERSNLYLEAGADLTFVTYVETIDEVKTLKKEVKGPISIAAGMPYNINNFTINDLIKIGVNRISFPSLLIYSCIKALEESLNYLKKDDLQKFAPDKLYSPDKLNELLKK